MKYPVIYIKNKGIHTSHFTGLTEGKIHIVSDITTAMRLLVPLNTKHPYLLYEQRDTRTDYHNIRFLRSWFPAAGILLISGNKLDNEERKAYLKAGVNSAITGNITKEEFLQTLHFLTDYSFAHKPLVQQAADIRLFRMPLWKRAFDILAASCAIIAFSPLLISTAIAIKIDSRGPIVYKSKRVGSNYRIFDFLKFRSMRTNADQNIKELEDLNQYSDGTLGSAAMTLIGDDNVEALLAGMGDGMLISDDFIIPESDHLKQVETEQMNTFVKFENDPRITPLGRFIRKYSIDELPQLFNILRGDMSVVGNRPLPLYEAENLTSDEYIERFMCPSGLTGLWQVEKRGSAGKLSPEQRKQLDIQYAKKMSFRFDLKIILRTFTAFIQKENV